VHFDIVPSLISVGALTTVMGLWMVAASYARDEANADELRIWGLSCLLFGIAFALIARRSTIPLVWSLIVGNFIFAVAYGGFGLAIAPLFKRRFPIRTVVFGVVSCTFALYLTEVLYGVSSWRILILAAVTIVPWTVSAVQCTREWRLKPAPHVLAMSLAFVTMIAVSIGRILWGALRGDFGYEGLPTAPGILLGSHILVISPVLLTVGFFLLSAEQTQQVIRKLADTDPLTGIFNRRSVLLLATNSVASARRHHHAYSCVLFDLDKLKALNDTHGHAAGDQALVALASQVKDLVRAEDVFGRLGGDEFVVFMPYSDLQGALALAERFRATLADNPIECQGHEFTITGSFGVATLSAKDSSPTDLIDRADGALYEAKDQGGNLVCFSLG
jgi:diguanylate cyclase (GGDEF)-like protein